MDTGLPFRVTPSRDGSPLPQVAYLSRVAHGTMLFMRDQRAEEFARCAVVLAAELRETRHDGAVADDPEDQTDPFATPAPTGDDPFAPFMAGREGIFDQALSNGLAAIVASEWPGKELDRKGRVLSASALLKVIEEHVPATDGIVLLPDKDPMPEIPQGDTDSLFQASRLSWYTRIDVRTLQNGIEASQAARHGRGVGGLQHRHIEALLALDGHRSLGVMGEEQQDRFQQTMQSEDAASQKRAAEYLERIGEEEAARRAENVANPNAYHPKHNPDGHDLDTCPVCGHETFCMEGLDPVFGRVGYGQCLVCTYTRTPGAAEGAAFTEHLRSIMDDD
ncbi:hypothetical protein SHL15_0036 [Streptomyces hygroscopicus subsp. limoneus]|nr:hypothetical protein SHL15_0036 [Streptomyces hygroscopicus subsp. limoneus]